MSVRGRGSSAQSLFVRVNKRGIKNELHVIGGGHTGINRRRYLNEFAPRLFR